MTLAAGGYNARRRRLFLLRVERHPVTVRHSSYPGLAAHAEALLVLRLDEWWVDGVDSLHGIHVHVGTAGRFCVWHIRASSVGMPHVSQERSAEMIYHFTSTSTTKLIPVAVWSHCSRLPGALHTLSGDDVCGGGVASVSGTLTSAFCLPVHLSELVRPRKAVKSRPLG